MLKIGVECSARLVKSWRLNRHQPTSSNLLMNLTPFETLSASIWLGFLRKPTVNLAFLPMEGSPEPKTLRASLSSVRPFKFCRVPFTIVYFVCVIHAMWYGDVRYGTYRKHELLSLINKLFIQYSGSQRSCLRFSNCHRGCSAKPSRVSSLTSHLG
ncbi:hypothetical protein F4777DRAFT_500963 [Nemania sp. FL0916]|nr:hypothetical protein F4777DRAFT_500963 [Nemania sp. FL0916]